MGLAGKRSLFLFNLHANLPSTISFHSILYTKLLRKADILISSSKRNGFCCSYISESSTMLQRKREATALHSRNAGNGWRDGLRIEIKGSSPGRVIVLCSWARHFTLTVPLSTQEYKWVPGNCQGNPTKCWEVTCDGLASHPGGVAILLVTSC